MLKLLSKLISKLTASEVRVYIPSIYAQDLDSPAVLESILQLAVGPHTKYTEYVVTVKRRTTKWKTNYQKKIENL